MFESMFERESVAVLFATCLLGLGVGCSPDPDPEPSNGDTGSDAHGKTDATDSPDSGSPVDAGEAPDGTSESDDAGDSPDGTSESDAVNGDSDGGMDSGGDGGSGQIEAYEDWVAESQSLKHKIRCDRFWECPLEYAQGRDVGRLRFPSREACKNSYSYGDFSLSRIQYRNDLKSGRVQFSEQEAMECLETLRSQLEDDTPDCSTSFESPHLEGCSQSDLVVPTSEQGEPCSTNWACVDDLVCDVPEGSCGGTCQPDPDEPAEGLSEGDECTLGDSECAGGLTCAPSLDDSSTTVCIESNSRTTGERCAQDLRGSQCQDGSVCAPDPDDSERSACVDENSLPAGDPCGGSKECPENHFCGRETADSSTAVCIEESSRNAGEPCHSKNSSDPTECVEGYSCGHETGFSSPVVCIEDGSRGEDEACSQDANCAEGMGCRIGDGTCKSYAVLEEGASCLRASDVRICKPGLICANSSCKPVKSPGESCVTPPQCAGARFSSFCMDGECTSSSSETTLPGESCEPGTSCYGGNECPSDGTCPYIGREACLEESSG